MHSLFRVSGLAVMVVIAALSALGQEYDKAFYGSWNLNVAASKQGVPDHMKLGSLRVGPEGWVAMSLSDNGALGGYAVAMANGQCTLIGMGEGLSCGLKSDDSRHVTWTIKRGDAVVRTTKIELVGSNKLTVKTSGRLSNGQEFTEEEVWEKPAVAGKSSK